MNLGCIYKRSLEYLKDKKIPTPDKDAQYIIAHFLKISPHEIFINRDREVSPFKSFLIKRAIVSRGKFKPIAYILKRKYFYRDVFFVNNKVLIPRSDTEHLIYAVEEINTPFKNILEIGTGSGAIAVSLSRLYPAANIIALDIYTAIARKNIKRLGIKNIFLEKKNFFKWMPNNKNGLFDLIISNPPYLSEKDLKNLGKDAALYEPKKAFYGGKDGLDFYRAIAEFAKAGLLKLGYVILEVDYKWKKVMHIFEKEGFGKIVVKKDYNDLERVLVVQKDF